MLGSMFWKTVFPFWLIYDHWSLHYSPRTTTLLKHMLWVGKLVSSTPRAMLAGA
jgi:hypothetical protein